MDQLARHRWIATHVLPLEAQARRWLFRSVRSLSQPEVDDLIQEAYSRICSADFSSIQNARAYFYQSLRNLLLEQARHAQIVPMERLGEIDQLLIPSEDPGPERRVGARQELERLRAIVASLPAQCRRAFELRKIMGFSQREAAAEMGISERTLEKHLAKALDRLSLARARGEGPSSGDSPMADGGTGGTSAKRD